MEAERSLEPITENHLKDLYEWSVKRLSEYFVQGQGEKWQELCNIDQPLAVALYQGGAMHYHDRVNGIKDFDVWFFYPFNQRHRNRSVPPVFWSLTPTLSRRERVQRGG